MNLTFKGRRIDRPGEIHERAAAYLDTLPDGILIAIAELQEVLDCPYLTLACSVGKMKDYTEMMNSKQRAFGNPRTIAELRRRSKPKNATKAR